MENAGGRRDACADRERMARSGLKARQRSRLGGLMHLMPRPRSRKRSSATASPIASSRSGSRRGEWSDETDAFLGHCRYGVRSARGGLQ